VAHDLQGPLTAIELATEILLNALAHDRAREAERKDMEVIRDAARWMQRMVGDLLDEAALASGRVTLRPAILAPETLVADAVRLLGARAGAQSVRIVTDVPAGLPPVVADRDRVRQVLANLIENAISVSAPGATIDLRATLAADAVSFAVGDSGPGIPAADLPYLFEPYWRANHDTRRGTGLGLTIARSIVEAHGGTINVRSAPGLGSTFVFSLPSATSSCQSVPDA
jgi:two-component system, OmpR family, phosphate regulon sensor histidine kinase PhoR